MKTTPILALLTLALACPGAATADAAEAPAMTQPMDTSTLETLTRDLARIDDGGATARAAADQAVKAGQPALLLAGLTNRLYDVRIHCIRALSHCPAAARSPVLAAALNHPSLWVRETKTGELIAGQERFLTEMAAAIQGLLKSPQPTPDLLDPAARARLASELTHPLKTRLQAEAARWEDGGQAARAACDTAVQLREVDPLLSAASNRLYDVRVYSVECLGQLSRTQQSAGLAHILRAEALWVQERKVGELIAAQERFTARVRALAAQLLAADLQAADLFERNTRASLAKRLAGD